MPYLRYFFSWAQKPPLATLYLKDSLSLSQMHIQIDVCTSNNPLVLTMPIIRIIVRIMIMIMTSVLQKSF